MSGRSVSSGSPPRAAARRSAPAPIDDVDRRLLDVLRDDGRVSITELATRAGVSRANAYQRVARLREDGVIRRFTVDADPSALGLAITAVVLVDIEQHAWREISGRLLALPGVEYVGLTTGPFDLVLVVRAPDMETLRDVVLERLQSMPEVHSTQTSFVLDELHR